MVPPLQRRRPPGEGRTLGAALLLLAVSCQPARAPDAPPIVFVSIDTLAAKHMSLYGYERATTPNIDRLARESIVFEHCLANSTFTTPSYVSQFAGLYAGCLRNEPPEPDEAPDAEARGRWRRWSLPEERHTLTEALAEAGYRTAAFIDNNLIGRGFGIDQGFEVYDERAVRLGSTDPASGIRDIVPRALAWIDSLEEGEPFFLFVQALDVHSPYAPGDDFAAAFEGDEAWKSADRAPVVASLEERRGPGSGFDFVPAFIVRGTQADADAPLPADVAVGPIVAAYDAEILALDDALGELFAGLRARGLLEHAILVLTADHGESMSEHGWYFNHSTWYEEVLRVPLLFRLPGARGAGARVAQTVQLVDLYPTFLQLAGLDIARGDLHGRSLVPLLEGGGLPDAPVLAEGGLFDPSILVSGGWKLIELRPETGWRENLLTHRPVREWFARNYPADFDDPRPASSEVLSFMDERPDEEAVMARLRSEFAGPSYELYDLARDPLELTNLATSAPEKLGEMRAVLERERTRVEQARESAGEPRGPAFRPDAAQLEELRRLGYAGSGE